MTTCIGVLMALLEKLTPLEWEVMDLIWEQQREVAVREILMQGYPNGQKAYTTIQTVMNHLVEKGYLRKKKLGLVNFYIPLFKKEEIMHRVLCFVFLLSLSNICLHLSNVRVRELRLSDSPR